YKANKSMIGIDVGTTQVKIVQMKSSGKLKAYGIGNIPEGLINQGKVEAAEPFTDMIKDVLKKNKIKGKSCALCLSNNDVIIREHKLPIMNDKQIRDNILHDIISYLPLEPTEYSIDYRVLEEISSAKGTNEYRIMVTAAPINLIQSYIKALRKARLNVLYVDVSANSKEKLYNYVMNTSGKTTNGNVCFIDFGAFKTDIVMLNNGKYNLHKTIVSGGSSLSGVIAETMDVDLFTAEDYKQRINFFSSKDGNNYSQVTNSIDYLLVDIERTIEFFKNKNNQEGIDHIYLSGGGSQLLGLGTYIEDQLGLRVSPITELLQNTYTSKSQMPDEMFLLSDAIGTTIRGEW
ncbi:MAG TPA: type IV pilus assembly protein PilM, partial [Bacillota bacterium]|nr:type IV pilus assembly protein PilM [Bacillota bacterium]